MTVLAMYLPSTLSTVLVLVMGTNQPSLQEPIICKILIKTLGVPTDHTNKWTELADNLCQVSNLGRNSNNYHLKKSHQLRIQLPTREKVPRQI